MKLKKLFKLLDPTQYMQIRIEGTDITTHHYPYQVPIKYWDYKVTCVYTVPTDDDVLHVMLRGCNNE